MVMLVSLDQASNHLRRDTDADDADLELKIEAASRAVLNYLKDAEILSTFLNSDGDVDYESDGIPIDVPQEIQQATLLLVGYFYKNRDSSSDFQMGYLPPAVMALLYPLRDPAIA